MLTKLLFNCSLILALPKCFITQKKLIKHIHYFLVRGQKTRKNDLGVEDEGIFKTWTLDIQSYRAAIFCSFSADIFRLSHSLFNNLQNNYDDMQTDSYIRHHFKISLLFQSQPSKLICSYYLNFFFFVSFVDFFWNDGGHSHNFLTQTNPNKNI